MLLNPVHPGARGYTNTKGNGKGSHHTLLKNQTCNEVLAVTTDINPASSTNTELDCRASIKILQN